jgi:hypothetical protein
VRGPDDPRRNRVGEICRALPEAEAEEGQHVRHSVRGRTFAWFQDDHHGDGRLSVVCKTPPGEHTGLAEREPDRFFVPAYIGGRGWVGIWLDIDDVDWDRVEALILDSYRLVAPKKLASRV